MFPMKYLVMIQVSKRLESGRHVSSLLVQKFNKTTKITKSRLKEAEEVQGRDPAAIT